MSLEDYIRRQARKYLRQQKNNNTNKILMPQNMLEVGKVDLANNTIELPDGTIGNLIEGELAQTYQPVYKLNSTDYQSQTKYFKLIQVDGGRKALIAWIKNTLPATTGPLLPAAYNTDFYITDLTKGKYYTLDKTDLDIFVNDDIDLDWDWWACAISPTGNSVLIARVIYSNPAGIATNTLRWCILDGLTFNTDEDENDVLSYSTKTEGSRVFEYSFSVASAPISPDFFTDPFGGIYPKGPTVGTTENRIFSCFISLDFQSTSNYRIDLIGNFLSNKIDHISYGGAGILSFTDTVQGIFSIKNSQSLATSITSYINTTDLSNPLLFLQGDTNPFPTTGSFHRRVWNNFGATSINSTPISYIGSLSFILPNSQSDTFPAESMLTSVPSISSSTGRYIRPYMSQSDFISDYKNVVLFDLSNSYRNEIFLNYFNNNIFPENMTVLGFFKMKSTENMKQLVNIAIPDTSPLEIKYYIENISFDGIGLTRNGSFLSNQYLQSSVIPPGSGASSPIASDFLFRP